jgi:Uma2 family endonuclease
VATVTELETPETVADLLEKIGEVPLDRLPLRPPIGTATERDVIAALERADKRLYELVDGVLVEKPMGTKEGLLASFIAYLLWAFLEENDLGIVLGADGPIRLRLRLVRIPDVCFIPWERLPGDELPEEVIAGVVPTLAVEVLSEGNTKSEMGRKLKDYFEARVKLVWLIDPKKQTAAAHTSPTKSRAVEKDGVLDGGKVLPGFTLSLKDLFARARRRKRKPR